MTIGATSATRYVVMTYVLKYSGLVTAGWRNRVFKRLTKQVLMILHMLSCLKSIKEKKIIILKKRGRFSAAPTLVKT